MIPALIAIVANFSNDPAWEVVRPPLESLRSDQKKTLIEALDHHGFDMLGLTNATA